MTKYRYNGKQIDGTEVSGIITARNESELEIRLINKGIFLESSKPSYGKLIQTFIHYFKRSEITKITRQINILLKSEIPILEALELADEDINDKILKKIFNNIILQVEAGKSIAAVFNEYPIIFDELYTSMIDTGELSGELDVVFDRIATYREKYEVTAKKVKSAFAYPLLVILVAVLVVFALILYVVPVFSSMYENFGAELPTLTQQVVTISTILKNNIWYWLMSLIVLMGLLFFLSTTTKFKYSIHKILVKLPLLKNLIVKIITSRFCRTMGTLLTSGVDIIYALRISSKTTGNLYVNRVLEPSELLLAQGKSFTESISSSSIFPKAMLRLTAAGEKTGRLGEMLVQTADYYEKETDTEISTLTTLIEPIIIIILGVFIAFILIAMYLPLFELVGTI